VSPEGVRLLAQGVSPGDEHPHLSGAPPGAADSFWPGALERSAAPSGAPEEKIVGPRPRADALGYESDALRARGRGLPRDSCFGDTPSRLVPFQAPTLSAPPGVQAARTASNCRAEPAGTVQ
jgi:hypothetical protein